MEGPTGIRKYQPYLGGINPRDVYDCEHGNLTKLISEPESMSMPRYLQGRPSFLL